MHPRDYIIKFCDELKEKLLAKFEKGRQEHGDGWDKVDCAAELNAEILDLVNYTMIHKAQQHGNAK